MDLLCVKLDLWPAGGAEHFLPDESDVLKTGRDLLIIQLQPPALEVALRGCSHTHAHTHTHNEHMDKTILLRYTKTN